MKTDILILRDPEQTKETTGLLNAINTNSEHYTCVTLERPNLGNQPKISCIPCGVYDYEKVPASQHIPYEHISVKNVPHRDGICIHILNYYTESEGCTGVGVDYSDLNGDGLRDLKMSKLAFDKLMAFIPAKGTIEYKDSIIA